MVDWTSFWRDFQERPLMYPFLRAWGKLLEVERGSHFPYYIYPGAVAGNSFEDTVVNFLDFLVDAHELERNKCDYRKTFYDRSIYFLWNFPRYSNDTMANLMFDVKMRKNEYDRMNSIIQQSNVKFYSASAITHLLILSSLSFMFRFRKLSRVQVLGVGTAYYAGFGQINNIYYKLLVDRNVINEARALGYNQQVQP